ncbi:ABC transporter permease, partial [Intestinimonas massiliensis]|nr:ABC transporter permease [Intestinimonas massiliensis (ex Afouda et al. 2020)]
MRNTLQYNLKNLLFMIPMVLVITVLIYGGLELTPGDAISHMIPPDQLANVDHSQLEALRQAYGLKYPFLLRYLRWLWE